MNFLPSPAVLLAFAAASALLAATPGPDMALFLSRTLGGGRGARLRRARRRDDGASRPHLRGGARPLRAAGGFGARL